MDNMTNPYNGETVKHWVDLIDGWKLSQFTPGLTYNRMVTALLSAIMNDWLTANNYDPDVILPSEFKKLDELDKSVILEGWRESKELHKNMSCRKL